MRMRFLERIRDWAGKKNYGLMKACREVGVEVTTQGLDGYDKENARSMRLDILCGLRKASGKSWSEVGKALDEEFLPK